MDSSNSLIYLIGILLFAILVIYIQVLLIRWVFKIEKQLSNQSATVWLLIKLCEKQGVPPEEVRTIMTVNNIK